MWAGRRVWSLRIWGRMYRVLGFGWVRFCEDRGISSFDTRLGLLFDNLDELF